MTPEIGEAPLTLREAWEVFFTLDKVYGHHHVDLQKNAAEV
ncbi:hypothetical protein [Mesorhizobium argentiipisi]|jgi:hypothetical protein|uniref:Uncharacterized protein n=1 Tax=Mesorhizobium argentiipisi TaxID=3015175 RepID=A0ABU8KBN1_9HYPH